MGIFYFDLRDFGRVGVTEGIQNNLSKHSELNNINLYGIDLVKIGECLWINGGEIVASDSKDS